jgi:hypothetical protein
MADPEATTVTVTLDLYTSTVNSYRYRELGQRDDWAIGDLYVKMQALPEPPPKRIEVTISYR